MSYKVAGIDVHKKVVMVVVVEAGPQVELLERKRFTTSIAPPRICHPERQGAKDLAFAFAVAFAFDICGR